MGNKLNWFEIPVSNMKRATRFYSSVFQHPLTVFETDDERTVALLPPGAGADESIEPIGTLLRSPGFQPGREGTVVYFDPGDELEAVLERVEAAGGKVSFPKFRIGHGFLATFVDSEGNTVGLLEWDQEQE